MALRREELRVHTLSQFKQQVIKTFIIDLLKKRAFNAILQVNSFFRYLLIRYLLIKEG